MALKAVKLIAVNVMIIRPVQTSDFNSWKQMRNQLWPSSEDEHYSELTAFFAGDSIDIEVCFVIEDNAGDLLGFIELNIRNFAEASRQEAVPYVEGWFIKSAVRGQGWGTQLMKKAESWAKKLGFSELASDTEIDNHKSIAIHEHLGFQETERVVCFLKKL